MYLKELSIIAVDNVEARGLVAEVAAKGPYADPIRARTHSETFQLPKIKTRVYANLHLIMVTPKRMFKQQFLTDTCRNKYICLFIVLGAKGRTEILV